MDCGYDMTNAFEPGFLPPSPGTLSWRSEICIMHLKFGIVFINGIIPIPLPGCLTYARL